MSSLSSLRERRIAPASLGFCLCFAIGLFGSAAHAMVPASERAVLDEIYYGTGGIPPGGGSRTWINITGWGLPPFLGISECGSYGVTCVVDQGQEHVSAIDLHENGLTGQLPPSLSDLPYLENFDVYGNEIGGSIPALAGLTKLQIFDVDDNQLTGSIPSLSGLANLQYFVANKNQLTGSLPALTGLTNLQNFDVDTNQLTGSLPALAGLTNLIYFVASQNQLTGPIPPLTGIVNLQYFVVAYNQLNGVIPELSGLTDLQYFYVDFNGLTGPIPALTGLPNLWLFSVGSNRLTGPIPTLTDLTSLDGFYVGSNQLTGSIPAAPPGLSGASLCPNLLTTASQPAIDAAWNAATGFTPWWATPSSTNQCDDLFNNGFEVP